MSQGIYDSSAVDSYMSELSKREQEKTRTRSIENFIKEAPYILMVWGGKLVALALLVMCIGWAIQNALSWDSSNTDITKIMSGYDYHPDSGELLPGDDVIDINELLNDSKLSDFNDNPELQTDTENVRDYYIFDNIEFNGNIINGITIGRVFADPSSPSHKQYCYADIPHGNGIETTFHFIDITNDVRTEKPITTEIANTLGVAYSELMQAKAKCSI